MTLWLVAACITRPVFPEDEDASPENGTPTPDDTGPGDTTDDTGTPPVGDCVTPTFTAGTWNLQNFSEAGQDDPRLDNLVDTIDELGPDILAVQEIRPRSFDEPKDPNEAFSALDESLSRYVGVRNPYQIYDTSVGLLYDPAVVTITATEELFDGDTYAFPRPVLRADLVVDRDGCAVEIVVLNLHLKAFDDDWQRRRDALQKTKTYASTALAGRNVLILGDLNDDPYDRDFNVFAGSFLNVTPDWTILTFSLPETATTSTGWHRMIEGQRVEGQFIDHQIANGNLLDAYGGAFEPVIHGVPESEFRDWRERYSDHFPVLVTFPELRE